MKESDKEENKTDLIKFGMAILIGVILYKLIFDVVIPMLA